MQKSRRFFAVFMAFTVGFAVNSYYIVSGQTLAGSTADYKTAVLALRSRISENSSDMMFQKELAASISSGSLIPSPVKTIKGTSYSDKNKYGDVLLPSKYDLRDYNRVSSVKNQILSGPCWSFASMGALESALLPNQAYDFSENNLKNNHGFDWTDGGNSLIAAAYFSRWDGPVLESQDPYDAYSTTSPKGIQPAKHVQDILMIPSKDYTDIKQSVMQYGAAASSIYADINYFNNTETAYYYNGGLTSVVSGNHMIDIVGWDDNYSRNNFAITPPSDGAFLVKDSQGTNFGDHGYYYVSYSDALVAEYNSVYSGVEDNNNYSNIYQYDPLGLESSIVDQPNSSYGDLVYANVFTPKTGSGEYIEAVSFYTIYNNTTYSIYVDNMSGNTPNLSGSKLKLSGSIPIAGYHTIKLPQPIPVVAGYKFAIGVITKNPDGNSVVPLEEKIQNYSSMVTANPGESFIGYLGQPMTDLVVGDPSTTSDDLTANVNIKAFTTVVPAGSAAPVTDLNTDGAVDAADLSIVCRQYNKTAAASDWNPAADINKDGIVDILDITMVSKAMN